MSLEQALNQRAGEKCELCSSTDTLAVLPVGPQDQPRVDNHILVCANCKGQIDGQQALDTKHWRCLNDSMWSPEPAVQVMAWRMLKRLSSEVWAQDLLEMLYLDEQTLTWAQAGDDSDREPTLDSNGTPLATGDTVVLIKDLDVKGAGFTAKRGTAVRGISLPDNPRHVEGKVNGVRIVLVAEYLKKS
ncbi:PhnA domain-containing protein [Bowmanella dokdonensis]|uniref:PhnA domain-containing protein n=1 Tax=Bowmanella dokdonensis TaxID=751969 RepID=A0A939DR28_9ALTE|nr:alkylphosphonate utilization protein [Bowmanella dokdonensis]MBN7826812.1 PhnA domain-containing protein [Bowmanella dokdonensis]